MGNWNDRFVITANLTHHAQERVDQRLQATIDEVFKKFNFYEYKIKYVDLTGRFHLFNKEYEVEIVGKLNGPQFDVFTIIPMSYAKFAGRSRISGLDTRKSRLK